MERKIVWLYVGYEDRKEVRKLGAKWDDHHKLWYIFIDNPHLLKFMKYIHNTDKLNLGIPTRYW